MGETETVGGEKRNKIDVVLLCWRRWVPNVFVGRKFSGHEHVTRCIVEMLWEPMTNTIFHWRSRPQLICPLIN